MAIFKVKYEGFYIIEADSASEALESSRDEAEYEECENVEAEEL